MLEIPFSGIEDLNTRGGIFNFEQSRKFEGRQIGISHAQKFHDLCEEREERSDTRGFSFIFRKTQSSGIFERAGRRNVIRRKFQIRVGTKTTRALRNSLA